MVDLIEEIEKGFCQEMTVSECLSHRNCLECEVQYMENKVKEWLSSFDTSSATECFTAVNILKERLENDNR